jgi:hypothetical protein
VKKAKSASEMLKQGSELVVGDRDKTHGSKLKNHENIAAMWNVYMKQKYGRSLTWKITPVDVTNMMALLKIARQLTGKYNPDDYIDGAAYLAMSGEFASSGCEK